MQIPKRLQVIGNLIPEGAYIADIGADHGLLEQYIALHLNDYHVLAIENKVGPLTALYDNAGCLKNVNISHSDGMNKVTSEYDTVVLAGMGGDNIINILTKDVRKLKKVNQIIVDAHSFIPKVRAKLIELGFAIDYEEIVYEFGVYYIIISFKRNALEKQFSKDEIDFGYKLYLDPLFSDYKKYMVGKYKTLIEILSKVKTESERYNEVCDELRRFESYGQN